MLKSHVRQHLHVELIWSIRPRRRFHPNLGFRLCWTDAKNFYRIEQFAEWTKRYWVYAGKEEIGDKRTLAAAKRLCERHHRERLMQGIPSWW